MEFDVVVEIPRGSRNKYEVGKDGRIHLDRALFTSMVFPSEYGYIDGTLAEDGDPLDAILLTEEPTFPGCVVCARPIALFRMTDEKGTDDKVVAVISGDPRFERYRDLSDLSQFERDYIQQFFESYKALEPGKFVADTDWEARAVAERVIDESRDRLPENDWRD